MRWSFDVKRTLMAAFWMALAGPARVIAAEAVFPPGAGIGLVPPAGMTVSKAFSGFEHRSGASIVVAEMPAEAYAQIVEKFTPEMLRPTGFSVVGPTEPLAVKGGEGRLLRGNQTSHGLAYRKWVAILRGEAGTALVTAQVPDRPNAQPSDAAIESALRSIAFRVPQGMSDQLAALPYAVEDLAGFRPVRVLAGSTLILTDGPKDVDPEGTQPLVVVASSLGPVPSGDAQAPFARKALAGLAQLKDIAMTDEDRTVRGDTVAIRHRATANNAKNGQPVTVTQTVMFTGGRYVRVIGIVPPDRQDALARTEALAASIRRK